MHRQTFARLIFLLSTAIFPYLVFGPGGELLADLALRVGIFILLAMGGAWLMLRGWTGLHYPAALLLSALVYGTAYKLACYIPDVSSYPFSLGWSEISRYYYASLFFAEKLYGRPLPLSVLHPTRYLMQSLPFLLNDSPLWLHRLWQVVLWVGTTGLASWLLWWRLGKERGQETGGKMAGWNGGRWTGLGFVLFAFLFLLQGPVYYHLLVMLLLVLWGYDGKHPWRTLFVVLIASLWAGVSRINWLPVPGMLAAAFYMLERRMTEESLRDKSRSSWGDWLCYMLPPAAWIILGSIAGYLSQEAYKLISGNPPEVFGSSFTSDLLWYRLLPNPTYRLGILPSAILVSVPLLMLSGLKLWRDWDKVHPLRLIGLAGMLAVLFGGGVVVSVKIGGGSNLHNLDAYLVLLLVVCSALLLGVLRLEGRGTAPILTRQPRWLEPMLIALTIAVPLGYTLGMGGAYPQREVTTAEALLEEINQAVAQADREGKEVLFITQRHLLTFDLVNNPETALVADYELVFLMEMAMSENRAYLDAFQADLKAQRYAFIVSNPLTTNLQGRMHSFGEENDAWVRNVSEPILRYYEPVFKSKEPGLMLLAPRENPGK